MRWAADIEEARYEPSDEERLAPLAFVPRRGFSGFKMAKVNREIAALGYMHSCR